MPARMSVAELLALPPAVDLPTAGRAWGLGRTKSHELARAGEFPCPVLRLGHAYRVTRSDLLRSLGIEPSMTTAGPAPPGPAANVNDPQPAKEQGHAQRTTAA